jgi:hypothetical protein
MPWQPRINPKQLKKHHDELALKLLRTREELQKQERYATGLEIALSTRLERIDELNGKLEQSREQIRRLDLQNEILIEMIAAPPVDAATPAK